MNGRDPRAQQEELARAEEKLAKVDAERDHLVQRISELTAQLSSAREKADRARQPVRPAAYNMWDSPVDVLVSWRRCSAMSESLSTSLTSVRTGNLSMSAFTEN